MTQPLGLTSTEAAERQRKGMGNTVNLRSSRSILDILRENFLSIANVILIGIVILLIMTGKLADSLVTGGVLLVNIVMGTFHEFRAKRKLDQIALLTRPHVTVIRDGAEKQIDQSEVVIDDVLVLRAGDQAVVDGSRLAAPGWDEQRLEIDESLLTGESDSIVKNPGDPIYSGSFCIMGEGLYRAEKVGEAALAQKITLGAREFTRKITPLQYQISIIVRVLVVLAISFSIMLVLSSAYKRVPFTESLEDAAVMISLVPQGLLLMITTAYTIGALRIAQQGALIQQSNAVESLSHVDMLCFDKTGTLTTNHILFHALHPLNGIHEQELRTRLGRYISSTGSHNRTAEAVAAHISGQAETPLVEIPFSSARKWAAASFSDGTAVFGAPEILQSHMYAAWKIDYDQQISQLARQGYRVLLFAHTDQRIDLATQTEDDLPADLQALGLISFCEELRPNVREVLDEFRQAGIQLKLISGDNPETVSALAYQAGFSEKGDQAISGVKLELMADSEFREAVLVHSIFGRITPQQKQRIVEVLRDSGHYVAMTGDGVNDVLSLKKAHVGIAMESGSPATRSVADIVLLKNQFEVLPKTFLEGQRIRNGMNDVIRLFLTRTLYTALLIMVVGFIGAEFPLTPRHNYLITTFPVGLPALFLTLWARTGPTKKSLLTSAGQFVFPAGFSLMVATVFIWVLYMTYGGAPTQRDIETGRTVLTLAAMLGGFWIIILAEHDRDLWRYEPHKLSFDRRRVMLAAGLVILFTLLMLIPPIRNFFELTALSIADLATIAGTMVVWGILLEMMLRYDLLERMIIPGFSTQPEESK